MTQPVNPPSAGNLFADLSVAALEEQFDLLTAGRAFRLKRIVSTGQATPAGEWYDQAEDEWVVLLRGAAALLFADEPQPRQLQPGDYLHIPAHCRHRVESTAANEPTVWLAVYFDPH